MTSQAPSLRSELRDITSSSTQAKPSPAEHLFRARVIQDESGDSAVDTKADTERYPIISSSSSQTVDTPEVVYELFRELFASAVDLVFEDGMETFFSRSLVMLTRRFNRYAFDILAEMVIGDKVSSEIVSEALRWLGYMEDTTTHGWRKWLLERGLRNSSSRIRDGAILGISYMNDPSSIPHVKNAIKEEAIPGLRHDMQLVLQQLEQSRGG